MNRNLESSPELHSPEEKGSINYEHNHQGDFSFRKTPASDSNLINDYQNESTAIVDGHKRIQPINNQPEKIFNKRLPESNYNKAIDSYISEVELIFSKSDSSPYSIQSDFINLKIDFKDFMNNNYDKVA